MEHRELASDVIINKRDGKSLSMMVLRRVDFKRSPSEQKKRNFHFYKFEWWRQRKAIRCYATFSHNKISRQSPATSLRCNCRGKKVSLDQYFVTIEWFSFFRQWAKMSVAKWEFPACTRNEIKPLTSYFPISTGFSIHFPLSFSSPCCVVSAQFRC